MNTKPAAGKTPQQPPTAPISGDEKIAKALAEVEELNKQVQARMKVLEEREKALDAREEAQKAMRPMSDQKVIERHTSKKEAMKKFLQSQPKVMIMIPLELGEKEGTTLPITLNGYRINIRKNTYVEVPLPIADLLKDILKQNEAAGRDFRLDIPRPSKDGVTYDQALG